jgi:hypothetical protein
MSVRPGDGVAFEAPLQWPSVLPNALVSDHRHAVQLFA